MFSQTLAYFEVLIWGATLICSCLTGENCYLLAIIFWCPHVKIHT